MHGIRRWTPASDGTTLCLTLLTFLIVYSIKSCSCQSVERVELPGDVILGGLFPVHENGVHGCGQFDLGGYQRLEAMVYALQKINNDRNLLPGIAVGAVILDTCSRDTYALEQAMDFVASTTNRIDLDAFTCPNGSKPDYVAPQPTVAVVGAAASPVSSMVANILRLFKVSQIKWKIYNVVLWYEGNNGCNRLLI